MNLLEFDDDVCFCNCGFVGDKSSIANEKSIDINFTFKEEQF